MKRIEEVTLLYEISLALNEHLDLKKSLYKVLDILSTSMDMVRGTITILDLLRNEKPLFLHGDGTLSTSIEPIGEAEDD